MMNVRVIRRIEDNRMHVLKTPSHSVYCETEQPWLIRPQAVGIWKLIANTVSPVPIWGGKAKGAWSHFTHSFSHCPSILGYASCVMFAILPYESSHSCSNNPRTHDSKIKTDRKHQSSSLWVSVLSNPYTRPICKFVKLKVTEIRETVVRTGRIFGMPVDARHSRQAISSKYLLH